jgi:hypothetical protein
LQDIFAIIFYPELKNKLPYWFGACFVARLNPWAGIKKAKKPLPFRPEKITFNAIRIPD